jgi:hypothetical protein
MKRVITDKEVTIVHVTDIENDHHVGILWDVTRAKGIIVKSKCGNYVSLSNNHNLSLEYCYTLPSKQEYAKHAIDIQNAEVFMFDTIQELLTWFAE